MPGQLGDPNLRHSERERQLQASVFCIISKKPIIEECCPAKKASDGVCTLIHCVDTESLSMNPDCVCGEIEDACDRLLFYQSAVKGLPDVCTQSKTCCDSGKTTNDEFTECMIEADLDVPDFAALIPGGLPKLPWMKEEQSRDEPPVPPTTTTTTTVTTTTTPATTTTTTTTTTIEATEVDPPLEQMSMPMDP